MSHTRLHWLDGHRHLWTCTPQSGLLLSWDTPLEPWATHSCQLALEEISKRLPDRLVSNEVLQECELPKRDDIYCVQISCWWTDAEQTIYATKGTHEVLADTISDPTVQAAQLGPSGQAQPTQPHSQSRQRKAWLLECGCTSDTRHLGKIQEKRQQHKTLLKALEMKGFDA